MAELSGLQVFKYLPAAKKLPEGNCKKCGFPTCMAFALKLAKNQAEIELCPYAPEELKEIFAKSMKKPQKEVFLGHKNKVLIGGENVLYRHDKTFINKTAIAVVIDVCEKNWEEKLNRVINFKINRINEEFKVDLIYLKGDCPPPQPSPLKGGGSSAQINCAAQKLDEAGIPWIVEADLKEVQLIEETTPFETMKKLTDIRKKAVLEKDENFSNPVYVYFKSVRDDAQTTSPLAGEVCFHCEQGIANNRKQGEGSPKGKFLKLMSKASLYLCKYANMLIFEDFDEALMSTLMTLRQNIYTDPQKPLQVESKVYNFNNADENSLVFLTTNFALTYFAVASEIESMNRPAYLVVTPSDGMSVLTAWSAEKFTAQIAAKTVEKFELSKKVKNKRIIIPGLLSHMKSELEEAMPDFEILVGPNEAYLLGDFVKSII